VTLTLNGELCLVCTLEYHARQLWLQKIHQKYLLLNIYSWWFGKVWNINGEHKKRFLTMHANSTKQITPHLLSPLSFYYCKLQGNIEYTTMERNISLSEHKWANIRKLKPAAAVGDTCNVIWNAMLERPSVEGYDLWKEPHEQINLLGSANHKMFVQMLKWHLGIKGNNCPEILKIAHIIFCWNCCTFGQVHKTMQWIQPLLREEAKDYGNSIHCINQHPSFTSKKPIYFQTSNVPKSELLCLLATRSSERGEHQMMT